MDPELQTQSLPEDPPQDSLTMIIKIGVKQKYRLKHTRTVNDFYYML